MPDDIQRIFEAWRKTRPNPRRCRFTKDRKDLIKKRLALGYEPNDLIAVIRYFTEANTSEARFMRGANDRGRAYLDLENLFRVGKLGARVETALNWLDDKGEGPPPDDEGSAGFSSDELDLGPMGLF